MSERQGESAKNLFNYAIYLYEMNADEVFDKERHVIVDSSLGLVEDDALPTDPG